MTEAITASGPALVVDSASSEIQAGVLGEGRWVSVCGAKGESLELVFELSHAALEKSGHRLDEIRSLVFCGGPGSTLGIRISAMALACWRDVMPELPRIFRYNALDLAASLRPGGTWLTALRRGQFLMRDADGAFEIIAAETLPADTESFHYLEMGSRFPVPDALKSLHSHSYSIASAAPMIDDLEGFIEQLEEPIPFSFGAASFRRWSGERHRRAK